MCYIQARLRRTLIVPNEVGSMVLRVTRYVKPCLCYLCLLIRAGSAEFNTLFKCRKTTPFFRDIIGPEFLQTYSVSPCRRCFFFVSQDVWSFHRPPRYSGLKESQVPVEPPLPPVVNGVERSSQTTCAKLQDLSLESGVDI